MMDAPATRGPPRPIDLRSLLRPGTMIFIGLWVGLLGFGRRNLFRDPGTFWHTVIGRQILESGAMIREDAFGFRTTGRPWISHQWLGECAMALIDAIAGLDTLLLATATLLAALYAWAAGRLLAAGVPVAQTVLLTVLGIAASSYHFLPRPHLVSIALFGWTFALASDIDAGRRGRAALLWLPAAFVVWTNMHGAVLGGLATLWLLVIGGIVLTVPPLSRWRAAVQLETPRAAGALPLTAVACTAALLVNPFGVQLPRTLIDLMRAPALPQIIVEHARLSLRELDAWMVVALAVVYLAVFLRAARRGWRLSWLIPLVWFALALTRIRHGPLFAIAALVALPDLFRGTAVRAPSAASAESPHGPTRRIRPIIVPLLLVLLATCLQSTGIRAPLIGAGWARLDATYWPVGALPSVRESVARGGGHARILNDMRFGGFLIYYVPDARVWIDDRCELYGEAALLDFVEAAWRHPERISDWADRYDAHSALVIAGTGFDRYLRSAPGWRCVYRDSAAGFFVRGESGPSGP